MRPLLLVALLASCGQPDRCLGPVGKFSGRPVLSINNCNGAASVLPTTTLAVAGDSPLRECRLHHVASQDFWRPGCSGELDKDVIASAAGYRGVIVARMTCESGARCVSVWEVELVPRPAAP